MAELGAKEKFRLKKFVEELEKYKGRHTELVSVYIPSGYDINKIMTHISQEQGTATNIKSTSTRKNVIGALERMIQHLKLFKQTPPNGLVAFSGNVAEREGQTDIRVWSVEPPVPLNIRVYRCDKEFVLEPLKEMMDVKDVYGMIVLDRRDAIVALLKGKTITPLVKTHSEVPGKYKAGGQSAHRFEQNRELAAKEHYKKVAEYVKEQFLTMENLKGLLVGGPGPTKYEWVEGGFVTDQLRRKIIAIKDLSYTEEFGLQELLEKCQDVLAQEAVAQEKELMQKFFNLLAKSSDSVSYGEKEVRRVLGMGAVDILLLSEDLEDSRIEEFEKIAESLGTRVEIISTETREGVQLRDLGKIAAILRYKLSY